MPSTYSSASISDSSALLQFVVHGGEIFKPASTGVQDGCTNRIRSPAHFLLLAICCAQSIRLRQIPVSWDCSCDPPSSCDLQKSLKIYAGLEYSMEDTTGISPRAVKLIVICVVFLPLAAIATCLRIWARRLKRVPLTLNDYLIIAALVSTDLEIEMGC